MKLQSEQRDLSIVEMEIPSAFGGKLGGVYFISVVGGTRIDYIGQSKDILQRILGYKYRGKFGGGGFVWFCIPSKDPERLERLMLAIFRPKLNTNSKSPMTDAEFFRHADLCEECGILASEAYKLATAPHRTLSHYRESD